MDLKGKQLHGNCFFFLALEEITTQTPKRNSLIKAFSLCASIPSRLNIYYYYFCFFFATFTLYFTQCCVLLSAFVSNLSLRWCYGFFVVALYIFTFRFFKYFVKLSFRFVIPRMCFHFMKQVHTAYENKTI